MLHDANSDRHAPRHVTAPGCCRVPRAVQERPEMRPLTKARALSDEELVGLGQGDAEAGLEGIQCARM